MDPSALFDPAACVIVGGGTALTTVLRTPAHDLVRAARAIPTLVRRPFAVEPLLHQIASLARIAQRQGVVMLGRNVVVDRDVAAAIAAIVDGASADQVEALVEEARAARIERHSAAAEVFTAAAEAAPAMGMVGTLIGLARMFADMDDTTAIGTGMAVALLATLYGALLANLVLAPIAARLRAAGRTEAIGRARLVGPLVALARRETPVHMLANAA